MLTVQLSLKRWSVWELRLFRTPFLNWNSEVENVTEPKVMARRKINDAWGFFQNFVFRGCLPNISAPFYPRQSDYSWFPEHSFHNLQQLPWNLIGCLSGSRHPTFIVSVGGIWMRHDTRDSNDDDNGAATFPLSNPPPHRDFIREGIPPSFPCPLSLRGHTYMMSAHVLGFFDTLPLSAFGNWFII